MKNDTLLWIAGGIGAYLLLSRKATPATGNPATYGSPFSVPNNGNKSAAGGTGAGGSVTLNTATQGANAVTSALSSILGLFKGVASGGGGGGGFGGGGGGSRSSNSPSFGTAPSSNTPVDTSGFSGTGASDTSNPDVPTGDQSPADYQNANSDFGNVDYGGEASSSLSNPNYGDFTSSGLDFQPLSTDNYGAGYDSSGDNSGDLGGD